MALAAAQRALASAGREASEIDTIIGASSSDNDAFPTVAGWLQLRLGLGPIRTNMLKGACACQTEAFQVAAEVLTTSTAKLVLILAAILLSRSQPPVPLPPPKPSGSPRPSATHPWRKSLLAKKGRTPWSYRAIASK